MYQANRIKIRLTSRRKCFARYVLQIAIEEINNPPIRVDPICLSRKAVSLIIKNDILDNPVLLPDRFHDLI